MKRGRPWTAALKLSAPWRHKVNNMALHCKFHAGSPEWLTMVGEQLLTAALAADLPPDLDVALVERYIDGAQIAGGLVQGLRFEIRRGVPSFRIGVAPDEEGDITIEVTVQAVRQLNQIMSDDPAYATALEGYQKSGALRIFGNPSLLGAWFGAVHDEIVHRTVPGRPRHRDP